MCFRYEKHYNAAIGRKKGAKAQEKAEKTEGEAAKKVSKHVQAKLAARKALAPIDPKLDEQFATGRLYGMTAWAVVELEYGIYVFIFNNGFFVL